jgi:beta-galactosidase
MNKIGLLSARRRFALVAIVLFFAVNTIAQSLTDVYNGERGSNFNAGWKFNLGNVSGAQAAGFNDASWRSLNLPHDWSIELALNQNSPSGAGGGYLDGGTGWYRKSFTLSQADSGKKILIEFDGIYMNGTVWINGDSLGTHPWGYTSFEYDLTSHVHYGTTANVIAVRVINQQPSSRFYSGSGIYRNVWLTKVNPVHVPFCGMFVSTPVIGTSSATACVSTEVVNQSGTAQQVTVYTSVSDSAGIVKAAQASAVVTINANAQSTFSQNLQISNLRLWSITSPYLYSVKTIVSTSSGATAVDSFTTTLGVRSPKFDANTGFSMNGQTIRLQGICMHQEFTCLGTAINYRAMERQVEILKDMGCNAIRTSHSDPSPEFFDICNKHGMLVMDEAFDCWESGKTTYDYGRFFTQWAQTDMRAQVRRDRNSPCVIMWSIGNEIVNPTVATATNLRNWVRMEDTTRQVTWASNGMESTICKQVTDVLDLAGYNYPRDNTTYSDYSNAHSTYPNWKIFGSETCAARRSRGIYVFPPTTGFGNLNPDIGSCYDNSFGSGGNSAETDLKGHKNLSFVAGEFIWTGYDYLGENDWPTISNNDGIIDRCGFPKDVYYMYQSQWSSTPMAHIMPHWNWNTGDHYLTATGGTNIDSSAISGTFSVPVWVFTNCDSAELFLNNTSLGTKGFQTNGALHLLWNVPFAAGTLRVVARKGGSALAVDTVRTAGAPAKVVLTADRTTINANGEDLAFITAEIVDANGVVNPRSGNTVNFSISGPGTIVGVDNGNSLDHSAYKATTRLAFIGKCLAVVQSAGTNSGEIVVTASSSGLTSGTVTIGSGTTPIIRSLHPSMNSLKNSTFAVCGTTFALPGEKNDAAKTISIFDLSGKLLRTALIKSNRIDLRKEFGIARGVYLVRVAR